MTSSMIVEPKPLDAPLIQEIAERIRARIRRTVADIIETGRDLAQVKAALDHGEFGEWIDHEFSMTMRTAQNYIRAATWAEGKNEIISHLPPRTLYLLSAKSTPEEIQAEWRCRLGWTARTARGDGPGNVGTGRRAKRKRAASVARSASDNVGSCANP